MDPTQTLRQYKDLFTYYELNADSIHCGYAQEIEFGNRSLKLWKEHDHYHVRYIDWDRTPTAEELKLEYVQTLGPGNKFRIWRTFAKLTDARKFFGKLLRDELSKQC